MKNILTATAALGLIAFAPSANAFCGFYVAKADTDLFNSSSKVALVRDGNRTVYEILCRQGELGRKSQAGRGDAPSYRGGL